MGCMEVIQYRGIVHLKLEGLVSDKVYVINRDVCVPYRTNVVSI
jgi:hypothetical protein